MAPPIVLALAKHPAVAALDLSSLEYVLSRRPPARRGARRGPAPQRLGLPPVLQAYGMTELSPGTHVVPLDAHDAPPGAVGKLLPSTEMRDRRRSTAGATAPAAPARSTSAVRRS